MHVKIPWETRKGFSLVELMTVGAVFSLVAMLAIPSILSQFPELRLERATAGLYSTLRTARMTAIHRNVPVEVSFDTQAPSCTLWVDDDRDGVRGADEVSTMDLGEAGGLELTLAGPAISYNSRGTLGGTNGLRVARLSNRGGVAKTVAVYPNGQVDVFDF